MPRQPKKAQPTNSDEQAPIVEQPVESQAIDVQPDSRGDGAVLTVGPDGIKKVDNIPDEWKAAYKLVTVRGQQFNVLRYEQFSMLSVLEPALREFAADSGVEGVPEVLAGKKLDAFINKVEAVETPAEARRLLKEEYGPTLAINHLPTIEALAKMQGDLNVFGALVANTYPGIKYKDFKMFPPNLKLDYVIELIKLYQVERDGETTVSDLEEEKE